MASQRVRTIFDREIKQFVGYFVEDANSLFKDEKNKLIHPGEFGKYREESCKNMLQLVLNNQVTIDDGFVITSDDAITTQCDIIVYNSRVSPIITDGISNIFPAEEVRLIGEVKSTLDKKAYIQALRKLAENKKVILEGRKGFIENNRFENKVYNTIGTFLICSKLNFDYKQLSYEEIYDGIGREYWHNAILSIEDGLLYYAIDFNKASEISKFIAKREGYNIEEIFDWGYSVNLIGEWIRAIEKCIEIKKEDKYLHIIKFFVCLAAINSEIWTYQYDPLEYLGFYKM